MNPLVSIIIPVYNKDQYLRSSLKSILEQDFENIEVLIYDDCSTDTSKEIILHEPDLRVHKFYGEINKGVKFARDFLLSKAKGDFISLFDGDDLVERNKISKLIHVFNEKPEVDFIGTKVKYVNEQGDKIKQHFTFESFEINDVKANLFFCNTFTTSSIIFKKELIPYINFQSFKFPIGEDYAIWVELAKKFNLINIPDTLTTYRVTTNGMMANTKLVYGDSIKSIHVILFQNLQIPDTKTYLDVQCRFMYAESISKFYLKKTIVFYNLILRLNNEIKYYNKKSFEKQIQINWLRKCIVFARTDSFAAIIIYFKYFKKHTFSSFIKSYILFIHAFYYLLNRKKVHE